jgi:hypothetical protein
MFAIGLRKNVEVAEHDALVGETGLGELEHDSVAELLN